MKSNIEFKEVRRWGNSGGIVLPKEWVGKQVKVILADRSLEIKKEVLKILEPWLEDIIGVYLAGSYSRSEQTGSSDIDIFAISKNIKKTFISGIYEIEIMPLNHLISLLWNFPAAIYPKIFDAKPIINNAFLEQIKRVKITRGSMKPYIEDCRKKIKILKKFIKDDEKEGNELKSFSVLYSVILRLKAFYLMKSILSNKEHTNKAFKSYLAYETRINEKQIGEIYEAYRAVARKKKVRLRVSLKTIKSLVSLLEKEVNIWYGKKKKEA
jgi:hypothetical protein